MDFPDPDVLIIGPGGYKGFIFLGALQGLIEREKLNKVKHVSGVSVGSLIALLYVIGYSVNEIIKDAFTIHLFEDISNIKFTDIKNHKGLLSPIKIKNLLIDRVIGKYKFIPTMKQLYELTNIDLVIVSHNLSKGHPVYFRHFGNDSDISCVDAVMYSINIPFVFQEILYKGDIMVDGALGDPDPIELFDDGTNNILSLYIKTMDNTESVLKRLTMTLNAPIDEIRKLKIKHCTDKCKHIDLNCDIFTDIIGIISDEDTPNKLIKSGYRRILSIVDKIETKEIIELEGKFLPEGI